MAQATIERKEDGTWEISPGSDLARAEEGPTRLTLEYKNDRWEVVSTPMASMGRAATGTGFGAIPWVSALGGGLVAVAISELIEGVVGSGGVLGGLLPGVDPKMARAVTKLLGAWAAVALVGKWKGWEDVGHFAAGFLVYDAAKELTNIDEQVRQIFRGILPSLGAGSPATLGGNVQMIGSDNPGNTHHSHNSHSPSLGRERMIGV